MSTLFLYNLIRIENSCHCKIQMSTDSENIEDLKMKY
jgi:hypothetical protein